MNIFELFSAYYKCPSVKLDTAQHLPRIAKNLPRISCQLEVSKIIRFDFRSDIDSVKCRIFDIQIALFRMSDFRHSISRPSNVENPTSEVRPSNVE